MLRRRSAIDSSRGLFFCIAQKYSSIDFGFRLVRFFAGLSPLTGLCPVMEEFVLAGLLADLGCEVDSVFVMLMRCANDQVSYLLQGVRVGGPV